MIAELRFQGNQKKSESLILVKVNRKFEHQAFKLL